MALHYADFCISIALARSPLQDKEPIAQLHMILAQ